MAPMNPKRPPRPRGLGGPPVRKPAAETDPDFGFEDGQILKADDPRPQLVAQYPVGSNSRPGSERIATGSKAARGIDRELAPSFDRKLTESGVQTAFLYVERGPGQGQLVPLADGMTVLGRSSSADFRLQHPSISRRHAQLTREGGRFFLKDLESQNGTFINRLRVTREVEVGPGDQIALGTVLLKLRGNKSVEPAPTLFDEDEGTDVEAPKSRSPKAWLIFGGSCVACLVAYTLVSLLSSNAPAPKVVAPPAPAATEAKPSAAPAPAEAKPTPPAAAPAPAPTRAAEPASEKPAHAKHAARREPAPKPAPAPAPSKPAKAEAASDDASTSSAATTAIRAKYEEGNVQAALELAHKSHANEWVKKLMRFRVNYDAARAALSSHNVDSASHLIQQALDVDEQIAEGWGTYNAELRSELTAISARTTPNAKVPVAAQQKPKKSSIDAAFDK